MCPTKPPVQHVGRGNISVTGGSLTRVEVQNQGTGNTDLGVVTDAVDVKLAGSGNTTIEGSAGALGWGG